MSGYIVIHCEAINVFANLIGTKVYIVIHRNGMNESEVFAKIISELEKYI